MAERLTPGVYVEEVDAGIKPIEGVATSTAGFIGEAPRGIPDRATFVRGFRDFDRLFGGHAPGEAGHLAQAVDAFFDAGGTRAYVVRVLPATATGGTSDVVMAREFDAWNQPVPVLRFRARGNGRWADHLRLHVEPPTAFRDVAFQVRVDWVEAGRSRTLERFDNVRMDRQSEDYVVEVVGAGSRYVEVDDLFFSEVVDADPPTRPPLPQRAPTLEGPELSEPVVLPEGMRLTFTRTDRAAGNARESATVEFTSGQPAEGGMAYTVDALRQVLDDAFAGDGGTPAFRTEERAAVTVLETSDGPWDISDAGNLTVTVDGNDVVVPLEVAAPAQIDLGAGPFAVSADDVVTIRVDGQDQSYTLVAGDMANDGAATAEEMAAVINREFGGLRAFVDAGTLQVRTDRLGDGATLRIEPPLAGAAADARGAGILAQAGQLTADELAGAFNAAVNAAPVFQARVQGASVRFVQVLMDGNPHAITWAGSPGPDEILPDGTDGVTTAAAVAVVANVATDAYVVTRTLQADGLFTFQPGSQVTLQVDGTDYLTDVGGDLTPRQLTEAIAAAETAANDPLPEWVEVSERGDWVVVTAEAQPGGVTVELSVDNAAPAPWVQPLSTGGDAGALVDSLAGIEITVSEALQRGMRRALGSIFTNVRSTGLEANSGANPDLRPELTEDSPLRVLGGSDGDGPVTAAQYEGADTAAGKTGLRAFDTVPIALLTIPGRNTPEFFAMGMAYADANDVFYVADGPGSVDRQFTFSADDARQFVEGLPTRSDNAAMFYPWLQVTDPVGVGRAPRRFVAPSGHIAGVFARTDRTRGVWKAPAGLEATVPGALALQQDLVDADQDLLNPIGLNCIRRFPNAGIVSWGARTLSSDPEWRYVPVRRTALFLKKSLERGMQSFVFEPNDQELWDQISGVLTAFMFGMFLQGAFQGATPEEAFAVKCDRETNPQELVDQGIVTAQVAFAPLKPAEFVVIQLSQKSLVAA